MASISIFPDEIMTEILLKLPVKSILKCNTLSKHYYSLIRSKFFIRRHLALSRLNDQSIVSPVRSSVRLFDRKGHIVVLETPLPIVKKPAYFFGLVVCGPVEGLYLVTDRRNERFTVWNPSTREQFFIPRPPPTSETGENSCELGAVTLMFDYHQCFAYGFGYDDTTDDYKFVSVSDEDEAPLNDNWFNVFSVRRGNGEVLERGLEYYLGTLNPLMGSFLTTHVIGYIPTLVIVVRRSYLYFRLFNIGP